MSVKTSSIPEILKSEPCCIGIDEAGRGPVLGPMVYGICICPISKKKDLKDLGVADSKTLTESKREDLFKLIDGQTKDEGYLAWLVDILSPTFISNRMLERCKYNLNALSFDSAVNLVKLSIEDLHLNVKELFIDTVGQPASYQAKWESVFKNLNITVAAKADALYPVVSAASICAKVARDREVKSWQFVEGIEFDTEYGSGYPSDPNTKRWLAGNIDPVFGFPQFVRFSWQTSATILDNKAVKVTWDDVEDEEGSAESQGNRSLLRFYSRPGETKEISRCHYFKDRNLKTVTSLLQGL